MTRDQFEKKWLKTFSPDLTEEQYHSCYVWQFLWHVFSYKLVSEEDFLSGEEAVRAFEQADKTDAITLWRDDPTAEPLPISDKLSTVKGLNKQRETFVVGQNWEWTYVSTHENGWCGPYFCRKKTTVYPWQLPCSQKERT